MAMLSEFSLHKEEVTGFLAPILDEGNSFIIMNGTMRGKKRIKFTRCIRQTKTTQTGFASG